MDTATMIERLGEHFLVCQKMHEAVEALHDEDRLVAFAADIRKYSSEPVLWLLLQHFPELDTDAMSEAESYREWRP